MPFDPEQSIPVDADGKPIAKFDPEKAVPVRGNLAEVGAAAKRGLYEGASQIGSVLQTPAERLGMEPGIVSRAGQAIEKFGKEGVERNAPQPEAHGPVTNFAGQAAEGLTSFAPTLAAQAGLGAAGGALVGGPVGAVVGGALGAGGFTAGSVWHEEYQKALAAGQTPDQARAHADHSAELQGGLMAGAGGVAGAVGKGAGIVGKALGYGAKDAAEAGANAIGKKFGPEFAKGAAESTAVNVGASVGGAAGQAALDAGDNLQSGTPAEAAEGALLPALGASVGFLPLAALGAHTNVQHARMVAQTLANPKAAPEARAGAVRAVYDAMAKADPDGANMWALNAGEALHAGQPIGVGTDWTTGPHPSVFPELADTRPEPPAPPTEDATGTFEGEGGGQAIAGTGEPQGRLPRTPLGDTDLYDFTKQQARQNAADRNDQMWAERDAYEAEQERLRASGPLGAAAAAGRDSGAVDIKAAERAAEIPANEPVEQAKPTGDQAQDQATTNVRSTLRNQTPMSLADAQAKIAAINGSEASPNNYSVVPHPSGEGYGIVPDHFITPKIKELYAGLQSRGELSPEPNLQPFDIEQAKARADELTSNSGVEHEVVPHPYARDKFLVQQKDAFTSREQPREVNDAIQESGAGGILQREQSEVGGAGSERGRVEQGVQGEEATRQSEAASVEESPATGVQQDVARHGVKLPQLDAMSPEARQHGWIGITKPEDARGVSRIIDESTAAGHSPELFRGASVVKDQSKDPYAAPMSALAHKGIISVREDLLNTPDPYQPHQMAHESAHLVDANHETGGMHSNEHPAFRIKTNADGSRAADGGIMKAAIAAWKNRESLTGKALDYPLRDFDRKDFKNMGYESAHQMSQTLENEVFAQLSRMYGEHNTAMKYEHPEAYALFKEVFDGTKKSTGISGLERSLRRALQNRDSTGRVRQGVGAGDELAHEVGAADRGAGERVARVSDESGRPLAVDRRSEGSTGHSVNIGLNTADGKGVTPKEALAALKRIVGVESSEVHRSDTERTLVASLDRPLTATEARALSAELRQEAIAHKSNGVGELYGPGESKWKPFNNKFYIEPGAKRKPLEGLPKSSPGPFEPARKAAADYMKSIGKTYEPPTSFVHVDRDYGAQIAKAYAAMRHAPDNPEVKKAYAAMIKETVAQWHAMMKTGLKVEFTDKKHPYPYKNPHDAVADVRDNNHLWVYSTDEGFGSDHKFDASDNPLLAKTGIKVGDKELLANDVFRAVHDYFGHVKEGVGFRANGEENAWRSHAAMYSDLARRAMTSETRGQNSWLNWGPHGEKNRTAKTEDTVFADQKTGLLPEEYSEDTYAKGADRLSPEVAAHLTPQEVRFAGEGTRRADKINTIFNSAPPAEHYVEAARAGAAAKEWYQRSLDAIKQVYGKDHRQFLQLMAALSPQTNVKGNFYNAVRVYHAWEQAKRTTDPVRLKKIFDKNLVTDVGREDGKKAMQAWTMNGIRVLTAADPMTVKLSGPKVSSFMENLLGNYIEVTNDRHMADFANLDQKIFKGVTSVDSKVATKGPGYMALSAKVRQAAKELGWTPAEAQAAIWSWWNSLKKLSKETGKDAVQLLRDGDLTRERIAAEPHLGSYLNEDEFRAIEPERAANAATEGNQVGSSPARVGAEGSQAAPSAALEANAQRLSQNIERSGRPLKTENEGDQGKLPVFYSALTREIDNHAPFSKDGVASAQMLRNWLKNNKNIKPTELEWTGLDDYLRMRAEAQNEENARAEQVNAERAGVLARKIKARDEHLPSMLAKVKKDNYADKIEMVQKSIERNKRDIENLTNEKPEVPAKVSDKITRDEVNQFLDQNGVRVEEKLLGGSDTLGEEQSREYAHLSDIAVADMTQEQHNRYLYLSAMKDADKEGDTQYAGYQLPGGKDYKELLLTMPTAPAENKSGFKQGDDGLWRIYDRSGEPLNGAWTTLGRAQETANDLNLFAGSRFDPPKAKFQSGHFDEPNILAHVRFNERTDPNGKKVLFIEELQSDWAQKGRKHGFTEDWQKRLRKNGLPDGYSIVDGNSIPDDSMWTRWKNHEFVVKGPGDDNYVGAGHTAREAVNAAQYTLGAGDRYAYYDSVPAAPFVTKTEAWVALAMKRMIRYAADNGFDRIAWANGEQQAARYDLSKHVSEIDWAPSKNVDGNKVVQIKIRGQQTEHLSVDEDGIVTAAGNGALQGKSLDEIIGKDIAKSILDKSDGLIDGAGLSIGGDGMKSFYDRIMPNVSNDVLKKLGGGRVDTADIASPTERPYVLADPNTGEVISRHQFESEMDEAGRTFMENEGYAPTSYVEGGFTADQVGKQAGFDVTPAMKDKVIGGQPLFVRDDGQRVAQRDLMPKVSGGKAAEAEQQFTKTGEPVKPAEQNHMPDWLKGASAEAQAFAEHAGVFRPTKPWRQRWAEAKKEMGLKIIQATVDQYRPVLEHISKYSYQLLRMASTSDNGLAAMVTHGHVELNKWGALKVKEGTASLKAIMTPLAGEHDRFLAWVAANRAQQLMKEGREHNFTPEQIEAGLKFNTEMHADDKFRGEGTRTMAYAKAQREFSAMNKSVLDVAEAAGVIDPEARKLFESDFYVNFRREKNGEPEFEPNNIAGMVNTKGIKRLKGGEDMLHDLLANTMANWSQLLSSALKNNAAWHTLEEAETLGIAHRVKSDEKGSVYVLQDGKQVHWQIDDPLVSQALSSLGAVPFRGPVMAALTKFKHALTSGVTLSPTFRINNVIRDQIAAVAANPTSYNFTKNLIAGFKYSSKNNPEYGNMLAGGAFIRMGQNLGDSRGALAKRLISEGIDKEHVLDNPNKIVKAFGHMWDWWQETGERSESITRAELYRQTFSKMIAEGYDPDRAHFEASYVARDAMDFGLHGTSAAIRMISQVVPFMNARLQGLYKLQRGAVDDPKRFYAVIGGVTLATIALTLAYRDDKDMQERSEWDRDNFWAVKMGDKVMRLPKPFEIGALATIVDRGLEAALDGFGPTERERFVSRLGSIVGNQLNMNPVPQAVAPLIQLWGNKSWFTNQNIETEREQNLTTSERIGPNTSATAQFLGKAGIMSPEQIDFAVNAYLGWAGNHALATADLALRPALGLPGKPAPRVDDYFLLGDFVKQLPSNQSRFTEQFYDHLKEVQQAVGDLRTLQQTGQMDRAIEQMREHKDEIGLARMYTHVSREIGKINQRMRWTSMRGEESMSAEQKRTELDRLAQLKNNLTEMAEKSHSRIVDRQQ